MSTARQAPTLADVARAAGVSTATVSRCLNDPDKVIDDTRRRVMRAVSELGYAPNFSARALASRRTNTVGAVIPTMENAIFARGLQAFQEELHKSNITLLVASSQYKPDIEDQQIRSLVARGADALLLVGYERSQTTMQFLEKHDIPAVIVWAYQGRETQLTAGINNMQAMAALAEKVVEFGHRRIGYITATTAGNDRTRDRLTGVKQAMSVAGLSLTDLLVVETPYSIDNGAKACMSLMQDPNPPTAIMCATDVHAVGALRGAQKLGLRVPVDLSITGFDNSELAQVVSPPLTTVHVPDREMGVTAARLLIARLNGEALVPNHELPTQLVLRDTLGPPAARH